MASRQQYMLEILLGAKTASSYYSSMKNAQQGIRSLSSSAKKAAAMITGAFAAVNVTGAIKDAVEVYSGFEQELASSAAIAGATAAEQKKWSRLPVMPERQPLRQPRKVQVLLAIWHLPDGMSTNRHRA